MTRHDTLPRRDPTPRVHFRKPSKAGTPQDHWTVCGLFRGGYQHTRVTSEVTCGHCLRWMKRNGFTCSPR